MYSNKKQLLYIVKLFRIKSMQAWWAEEASLKKNISNLNVQKYIFFIYQTFDWWVIYIPEMLYCNIVLSPSLLKWWLRPWTCQQKQSINQTPNSLPWPRPKSCLRMSGTRFLMYIRLEWATRPSPSSLVRRRQQFVWLFLNGRNTK